jgi:penicillin-binding protein 1A
MIPAVQRAAAALRHHIAVAWALVKRHPWRTAMVPPALLAIYLLVLIPLTPSISDLRKQKSEVPTRVLSADGVLLAEFKRVNREWVPLSEISPNVINALIATEDRRFYQHHGIDFHRLGGAIIANLHGDRQGGSTITQQLARNLYPDEIGRAPSLHRKAKEAITALKIEAVYTKNEILETYLNTVPFLYNAFGIEMAARTYFDKSAQDLDVLESATLIGMLKGTAYYNPVLNPERALDRRNIVLEQMAKFGKLDAARLPALERRPLRLDFEKQVEPPGLAPHVAQAVRQWLIGWTNHNGDNVHAEGFVVHTTINSRLQRAADQAVARRTAQLQSYVRHKKGVETPVLQAGFYAIDPRDGEVKAWVGSRDFGQEPFDHVTQARRQPGSTFKPFVYGAAFIEGFSPSYTFMDEPVTIGSGSDAWTPSDVHPPSGKPTTLRDGLVYSKNTITAQLIQKVGVGNVAQLARAMGVRQSKLDLVPSLALGTSPVTLKEMVTAYGSIANAGNYVEPFFVQRVEDREGKTLEGFLPHRPEPAMPRGPALTLVNVMRGVVDEGTGVAIRQHFGIQADVAAKTGTTQDNTDGWFIMMHPQLVAGAWVGFDDNRIAMGDWGQGARSALPMVGDVFQQALHYRWIDPQVEFPIPRPRPKPRTPPPARSPIDPLMNMFNKVLRGIFG